VVADHQGRERQGGIGRFVADMLGRDAVTGGRKGAHARDFGGLLRFLEIEAGKGTRSTRIPRRRVRLTRPW
jgi:hypothetical protein